MEAAQNTDGGWPYEPGRRSWTEPSVFALLSGVTASFSSAYLERGFHWLRSTQNSDGGWSPQPGVGPSTWVTALVALLPPNRLGNEAHAKAVTWLLRQAGQESDLIHRLRQWMLGNQSLVAGAEKGWPWYPGAAAWVMPTAMSLVALRIHAASARERIRLGTEYLLLHACKSGGWNHGSTRALGYESSAYPETTGVALLALRGVKAPEVDRGIEIAQQFLDMSHCAGASWLRIGLQAQGCNARSAPAARHARKLDVAGKALEILSENPHALFA